MVGDSERKFAQHTEPGGQFAKLGERQPKPVYIVGMQVPGPLESVQSIKAIDKQHCSPRGQPPSIPVVVHTLPIGWQVPP
jgi:hypothetical protein